MTHRSTTTQSHEDAAHFTEEAAKRIAKATKSREHHRNWRAYGCIGCQAFHVVCSFRHESLVYLRRRDGDGK